MDNQLGKPEVVNKTRCACPEHVVIWTTVKKTERWRQGALRVQPGNPDFNRTRTEMGTVKDALKVGIKI